MVLVYFLLVLVLILVYIFIVLFFIAQVIAVFTTDAPFVPIPNGIEEKVVETLKLDRTSVLYDLGCGDARVLIKAVEKYPNIKAIGIEKSIVPYLLARFYTRKNKNIEIIYEDIFKADISKATHIFIYLYPQIVERLAPIFEKKCKKGTRIVSCDFEDKNGKADEIVPIENTRLNRGKNLFVYNLK